MSTTRRTALQMLGLTAVATPIATEAVARLCESSKIGFGSGADTLKHMIRGLRALADDIEAGRSHAIEMRVSSVFNSDEFLVHTLQVDFAMELEEKASA